MPAATVTFHRLAGQEYRLARSWYARRSQRAAIRFIQAVDTTLQQIAADPKRWPRYDDRHRWVKMKKYTYVLIYGITGEDRLTIVAVAHASRRSGYWRRRSI